MINQYLPGAATSAAKDGEAPESSLDGSLREKQHKGGTACVFLADKSIQGSTPALGHHDCACHSCSAALSDQRRRLLDRQCVCSCITKSLLSVSVGWFAGGYSRRLIEPWL